MYAWQMQLTEWSLGQPGDTSEEFFKFVTIKSFANWVSSSLPIQGIFDQNLKSC